MIKTTLPFVHHDQRSICVWIDSSGKIVSIATTILFLILHRMIFEKLISVVILDIIVSNLNGSIHHREI